MTNQIAVSVTADVSSLVSKRAVMSAELKAATSDLNSFAKQANASGMTKELQASMLAAADKVAKVRAQISLVDKEMRKLSAEGGASAFESIANGLERVKGAAEQLGGIRATVMGIGEAMAAAFAVDEIQKAVEHAVDYGAEIAKTAKVIGVTTDFLQEFNFAAKQSEVDVGAADDGLKSLNASLGAVQANLPRAKQLAVTFKALGFTSEQLRGYRDASELLPVLADRIQAIGSAAERAAIVRKLGIEQLLPLLDLGSAKFNTLTQRARDLGVVMDASLVKQSEDAKAKLNEVDQVVQAKLNIGMAAFAGTLIRVKEAFGGAEIAALHFLATVTGTLSPLQKTLDDLKDYNRLVQMAHVGPGGVGMHREAFDEITKKLKDDTAALREWNKANAEALAESSGSGAKGAAASQLVPDKPTRSSRGDSGAGDESDMQALEEKFKQEQNAHNDMIRNMQADELAYWSSVKTNIQGGALTEKDAATIREKVSDLTHQVAMQGIEDEIAARRNADDDAIADIKERAAKQKDAVEQQIKDVEEAEKSGQVTHQAATAKILALIDEEKQAATDAANAILAIKTATDTFIEAKAAEGTAQFKAAQRDQVTAATQAGAEIVAADDQSADAIEARSRRLAEEKLADQRKVAEGYKEANDEIMGAEDKLVSGILSGRESMSQIELGIAKDLVQKEIENDLHYVSQKLLLNAEGLASDQMTAKGGLLVSLLGLTQKTAATVSANATQTASTVAAQATQTAAQVAGAGAGMAASKMMNQQTVLQDAGVAAAGAYAAVSKIPLIGPLLAPEAAAVAYAGTMAFGGFAEGINVVPRDMVAQIHAGERIIPRSDNSALMAAVGAGAGSRGAQTNHFNQKFEQHFHEASPDPKALISAMMPEMMTQFQKMQRRGMFK